MCVINWQLNYLSQGEIYTRSYREREQATQQKAASGHDIKLRKIAITVPNATRKESEKHVQEDDVLIPEKASIVTKKAEKRNPARPIAVEYEMVASGSI